MRVWRADFARNSTKNRAVFAEKSIVERFDLPLIESIEFSNLLQSNYSIGGFHIFGFIKENISFAGPPVVVFIEEKQTFDASL